MDSKIEKKEEFKGYIEIIKRSGSMGIEFYDITCNGQTKQLSKYSRLEGVFEVLKEIEK